MSKFNTASARPAVSSPVTTEQTPTGSTFEGGAGYARDTKSELFLLAVTNMVGENTFYEGASDRDTRYQQLVRDATILDSDWTARFLAWLRGSANMRSASLVGAAEFVKARRDTHVGDNAPGERGASDADRGLSRQVIDSVLQRADEPGEMLAYWTSRYGRRIPKPVKRGVADAVQRLYDERALLKYDTSSKGFRFGDVIDLVHPAPRAPWQGVLFQHALDRRHNRDTEIPGWLGLLGKHALVMSLPVDIRRARLLAEDGAKMLHDAGMTWESLAGWLQGPMDAAAWEAIIPSMGLMALVRNLRNFDQAGVSDKVAKTITDRLADPEQVAKSRQLPMRFLSAYRAAPSLRWAWALEQAITHSLNNIPALNGRTLILVDTSSSMHAGFSKDGTLMRWDAAAIFGIALGHRCETADVVSFSSAQRYFTDPAGTKTRPFPAAPGESLLRSLERWKNDGYFLGGGTDTPGALRKHFRGHDRVVILTDEQATSDHGVVSDAIPASVPLYTWNLAGYQHGHAPSGAGNRHTFGGLTDQAFGMIPLLEASQNANWPF